jgi:hypothetical protein
MNPPVPTSLSRGPGPSARSVHRLGTQLELDAGQIAQRYFQWLATQLLGLIGVRHHDSTQLDLLLIGVPVVKLRQIETGPQRHRYDVVGGWLVAAPSGTFEFLCMPDQAVYAVLDGFRPRLPWLVYRMTHAYVHDRFMCRFSRTIGASQHMSSPGHA